MRPLKEQLLIFIIPALIAAIAITATFSYYSIKDLHIQTIANDLQTLSESKADHLKYLFNSETYVLEVETENTALIVALTEKSDPKESIENIKAANAALINLTHQRAHISDAMLIDKQGNVIASSDPLDIGMDKRGDSQFIEGIRGTHIKSPYYGPMNQPTISIATNIKDRKGNSIGVIAARYSMETIWNITTIPVGDTATGEILLINKDGYIITPVKFLQNTFLKIQPKNANTQDCLTHLQRKDKPATIKTYIYNDYRGEKVIGTHATIPEADICLITKIDYKEYLAPIERLKKRMIAFTGILTILLVTIVMILSQSITISLNKISSKIEDITRGELDIKLDNSEITEIQQITDSLNRILASLKLAILRKGITKEDIGIGEVLAAKEKAEKERKEAESMYRNLFDQSSDALMTLEPPDWRFTSANNATVKLFGAKDEKEFTSKTPFEWSPPRQADGQNSKTKALKMIEKGMKEGSNYFEWTHKRADGTTFPATILLTRSKVDSREFLQATVRDISAQRIQEEQYKQLGALMKNSSKSSNLAVYNVDFKRGKLEWSETIDRMLGYPKGKAPRTMKSWEASIHPADRKLVMESLNNHLKKKTRFDAVYRIRKKDGKYSWWHDTGKAVWDSKGNATSMSGTCFEISPVVQKTSEKAKKEVKKGKDGKKREKR